MRVEQSRILALVVVGRGGSVVAFVSLVEKKFIIQEEGKIEVKKINPDEAVDSSVRALNLIVSSCRTATAPIADLRVNPRLQRLRASKVST